MRISATEAAEGYQAVKRIAVTCRSGMVRAARTAKSCPPLSLWFPRISLTGCGSRWYSRHTWVSGEGLKAQKKRDFRGFSLTPENRCYSWRTSLFEFATRRPWVRIPCRPPVFSLWVDPGLLSRLARRRLAIHRGEIDLPEIRRGVDKSESDVRLAICLRSNVGDAAGLLLLSGLVDE